MTQVFISWSGEKSRRLAEIVRDWLPSVLQYTRPFFTPSDIEKGAKWQIDIAQALDKSDLGLLCITPENATAPWILFEAGALSKNLGSSRVSPIVFGINPSDLPGPLSTLQATSFNREDFFSLITGMNRNSGDQALETSVLEKVFDKWWPDLEEQIGRVLSELSLEKSPSGERKEREILEEILELTRLQSRRSTQLARFNLPDALLRDIADALEIIRSRAGDPDSNHFDSALWEARAQLERAERYLLRRERPPRLQNALRGLMDLTDDNRLLEDGA